MPTLFLCTFVILAHYSFALLKYYISNNPIDLQFEQIKPGYGNKPFLTCQKGNELLADYHPIKANGYDNVVEGFATTSEWNVAISWKVVLPEAHGLEYWVQKISPGYYLYFVTVGERTVLKANRIPEKFMAGQVWSWSWSLIEPPEEQGNLLMLLASRKELDLVGFENAFNQRFQTRPVNLTAARNFIARQAPGLLPFIYQEKKTGNPCDG